MSKTNKIRLLPIFLVLFALIPSLQAQIPDKMSYQAIVRDVDQKLIVNSNIHLKVALRQKTLDGSIVYEETHMLLANANGLVTTEIGTGTQVIGDFSEIEWASGPYFLETQVDPSGGTNFSINAVSQLLSVPYALHAKTAESLSSIDGEYPKRAKIISLKTSRLMESGDVDNTIECTASATLTLADDFLMQIGQTINLEAHNGAVLTIEASSDVSINYVVAGRAQFKSSPKSVRFGFLRKIADKAYIISGQ